MKFTCSEDHRLHFPQAELHGGEFVTPFERPSRVEYILNRLRSVGMTDLIAPDAFDPAPVAAIHDADFLEFLATAWAEWTAAGYRGEILPTGFPMRRMQQRVPDEIDGKAGYYCLAAETAITGGTWEAALSSAASAQAAQKHVAGGAQASPPDQLDGADTQSVPGRRIGGDPGQDADGLAVVG